MEDTTQKLKWTWNPAPINPGNTEATWLKQAHKADNHRLSVKDVEDENIVKATHHPKAKNRQHILESSNEDNKITILDHPLKPQPKAPATRKPTAKVEESGDSNKDLEKPEEDANSELSERHLISGSIEALIIVPECLMNDWNAPFTCSLSISLMWFILTANACTSSSVLQSTAWGKAETQDLSTAILTGVMQSLQETYGSMPSSVLATTLFEMPTQSKIFPKHARSLARIPLDEDRETRDVHTFSLNGLAQCEASLCEELQTDCQNATEEELRKSAAEEAGEDFVEEDDNKGWVDKTALMTNEEKEEWEEEATSMRLMLVKLRKLAFAIMNVFEGLVIFHHCSFLPLLTSFVEMNVQSAF
ncbi:hypothetical protein B0H34DRAFT_675949 [Crassisporium funariophilum]|nr:hypothetical protein B0H34DRAFT_675949 [Crassisporium funariophilum]